jgi:hypothetical protein
MTTRIFQAGFDITEIGAGAWLEIMKRYGLCDAVKDEKTWLWKGPTGFVVTACNPITGIRSDCLEEAPRIGYAGYIGIEGNAEFTAGVFVDIKKRAEHIKHESFGTRTFI